MIVDGQIMGGLAEGVGIALMEVITFDEQGNCLNGSMMDYLIPTALECPDWELGATVTPCPHHPIGAKGVGESATNGSPPAIVNAVCDALYQSHGVAHIDMPLNPARVWAAMQGRAEPPAVATRTARRRPRAALAAALGRRLRDAGLPVTHERSARFARAVALVAPRTRDASSTGRRGPSSSPPRRSCPPSTACSPPSSTRRLEPEEDRGDPYSPPLEAPTSERPPTPRGAVRAIGTAPTRTGAGMRPSGSAPGRRFARREIEVPLALASDEERLAEKSFDALEPDELARLRRTDGRARAGDAAAAHAPSAPARDAANASTCGGLCARACAPAATRSSSCAGAGAPARAAWCCSATSPARWSRTRAPTCSCWARRSPAARRRRRSSSPPG